MITLKNGKRIEYHASYNFPMEIYSQFTDEQINTLKRERREYKQRNGGGSRDGGSKRTIEALHAEIEELKSMVSGGSIPSSINGTRSADISQMSTGTPFGGRNEQKEKRRRSRDNESE